MKGDLSNVDAVRLGFENAKSSDMSGGGMFGQSDSEGGDDGGGEKKKGGMFGGMFG